MQTRLVFLYVLCFITLGWLTSAATAQGWPRPHWSSPDSNVLAEFRIPRDGSDILLPVHIAGRTFPFALDTGCSTTAFDVSLRPLLGQTLRFADEPAHAGICHVEYCRAPQVSVGTLAMPPGTRVAVLDMRAYRARSAHYQTAHMDFYGLIGLDFLRHFVLDFDFDRGRLAFLRRPPVSAGFAIPMLASAYE